MTQNKVLPGAYINFVSRPRAMGSLGERGVVCVGMELDWGREGMTDIAAAEGRTNCRELFGYTYLSEEMKDLRELFAHAKEVKLYRLNGGEKARMTQRNILGKEGTTSASRLRKTWTKATAGMWKRIWMRR